MRFSIICSVYNAESFISKCIESVLNNSFTDWELILLDDASTDKTFLICEEYSKNDNRIKVVKSDRNIGPYNERIKGYLLAKGEYILNIDSDDSFCDIAFEIIDKKISQYNPDLIIYNENRIEQTGTFVLDKTQYEEYLLTDPNIIYKTYFQSYLLCQGLHRKCFKRKIIETIDTTAKDSKMFEDGLFSLKVLDECKTVMFINDCLYNYRDINEQSLTKKYFASPKFDFGIILEKMNIISHSNKLNKSTKSFALAKITNIVLDRIVYIINSESINSGALSQLKLLRKDVVVSQIISFKFSKKELHKRKVILFLFKAHLFRVLILLVRKK